MFFTAVLFLVAALVAFGFAFSGGGTSLLYVSILCSIAALALVARAVLRERTALVSEPAVDGAAEEPSPAPPEPPAQKKGPEVVALPERGTYHTAACRYVKGRGGTERIPRATAKRRGYAACGVCKPG